METEAYRAVHDATCHTFMRPSAREFVAEHEAGDAYVYLNYGVHWRFGDAASKCLSHRIDTEA